MQNELKIPFLEKDQETTGYLLLDNNLLLLTEKLGKETHLLLVTWVVGEWGGGGSEAWERQICSVISILLSLTKTHGHSLNDRPFH